MANTTILTMITTNTTKKAVINAFADLWDYADMHGTLDDDSFDDMHITRFENWTILSYDDEICFMDGTNEDNAMITFTKTGSHYDNLELKAITGIFPLWIEVKF